MLHSHVEGFQDTTLFARFEVPPADLPAFEASIMCKLGPVASTKPHALRPLARPWWTPGLAAAHRACAADEMADAGYILFHQSVVVDVSSSTRYVVYVLAFDT